MKSSDNTRYLNSFADNNETIPKRCTSSQPVEFTSCCSPEEERKLTWGNITEDASQENLPYLPMESSDIKITRYLNSSDIADNNEPISKTYTSLQPVEFPSCCSPENNIGANNNEDKNERIISDENIFLAKESVGNFENEIAFETEVGGGYDYSFDNNSVQNSSEENAILSDDGCVFSPDKNECNFTESRENNIGSNNNEDENERRISDENIFLANESDRNFPNESAFGTEVDGGNDYSSDNNLVQNSSEENSILSDDGSVFSPDENECNFTESSESIISGESCHGKNSTQKHKMKSQKTMHSKEMRFHKSILQWMFPEENVGFGTEEIYVHFALRSKLILLGI
ncbi:hypothetical protein JTB14_008684 [Gonioctena quinquepunctata]|nr:hypothetical protein JTB14_008684 [Gonioctena quinquepunctata]